MPRAINRLEQKSELGLEHRDEPFVDRPAGVAREFHRRFGALDQALAQRAEDLLLALEAEINGALGDLSFVRDVIDRGAPVAVLAEQLHRRVQYRRALGFFRKGHPGVSWMRA